MFMSHPAFDFLANPPPFDYPYPREWLGPGGSPGLQNRWRVALRAAVGSTPIHSRLVFKGIFRVCVLSSPSSPLTK
jgi:hypothetical protein